MTICMAALSGAGTASPAVVVASDRMVTMGGLTEFEHAVPKVSRAGNQLSVVLGAGDALAVSRLVQGVLQSSTAATVSLLTGELAQAYTGLRRESVEAQVLGVRGLTLADFYGHHSQLNPQIAVIIDQQLQQFNLGVELLVAGVDGSGSHIYSIQHPGGTFFQHDVIGYAAIGSGALHAVQSMIGFGHTSAQDLPQTIFRVYASKRRAEVAPGVGHDTDLLVVTPEGIKELTDDKLKVLDEVYLEFAASAPLDLAEKLSTLELGETKEAEEGG